jgi:WD40 repeat protein
MWLALLFALLLNGCGGSANPEALTPRELKTDVAKLSLVRFSQDGSYLAAGSTAGDVIVWSDISIPPTKFDPGYRAPLVSLTWAANSLLTATDLDNGFVGWQLGQSEPTRIDLPGLPAPAVCVAFRPKSKSLDFVIGSRDGSLIFLESKEAKQIKPDHRGAVKQLAYTPDGRSLITAGADGKLIWREAASRKIVEAIQAHEAEISRLVLSSDGKQLITGDWNGRIKLWDTTTRKTLQLLEQPEAVSGLGWLPSHIVSGSWDGSLRLWNASTGQLLRTIPTGQPIHDLSVDPRTNRVATVCLDRWVRLWELPSK